MPASLIDGTPIEPLVTCKLLGVHWLSGEHELQTFGIQFHLCCHACHEIDLLMLLNWLCFSN